MSKQEILISIFERANRELNHERLYRLDEDDTDTVAYIDEDMAVINRCIKHMRANDFVYASAVYTLGHAGLRQDISLATCTSEDIVVLESFLKYKGFGFKK